jgi:hypothetical protein
LEVGLFFGRLGRDRCFLIQRSDFDLKLPTDLLGIELATFSLGPEQELETALEPACARIASAIDKAIHMLPSRPRLTDDERAAQATNRRFGDRIVGTWWERIRLSGRVQAISFFTVELDEVHSSVRLNGRAYSLQGAHRANWRSAGARLEAKKILYVRECQRLDASTTAWLPGLGVLEFEDSTEIVDQGQGKFWESDESHPDQTIVKLVEVKRNRSDSDASTMLRGSEKERAALAKEKQGNW